jgi:hypothetical protein
MDDFDDFFDELEESLVDKLNKAAIELNNEIVRAMPVGIGGELSRSWSIQPASEVNPAAKVGTSSSYFIPLEVGRKPGRGISEKGQLSVALWGRRKLGMTAKESEGFAYLLSQKYKREGRPATGLIGLATPGAPAKAPSKEPVPGSIIHRAFQKLRGSL